MNNLIRFWSLLGCIYDIHRKSIDWEVLAFPTNSLNGQSNPSTQWYKSVLTLGLTKLPASWYILSVSACVSNISGSENHIVSTGNIAGHPTILCRVSLILKHTTFIHWFKTEQIRTFFRMIHVNVKDFRLPRDKKLAFDGLVTSWGFTYFMNIRKCDSYFFHDSQGSDLQKITRNETTRIFFFHGNIDMDFLRCKTPHGGFSSLLCDRWPEGMVRNYFQSVNVLFPILPHTLGFQTPCFWRYDWTPKPSKTLPKRPSTSAGMTGRLGISILLLPWNSISGSWTFSRSIEARSAVLLPLGRIESGKGMTKLSNCDRRNPFGWSGLSQCHDLYQSQWSVYKCVNHMYNNIYLY